MAKRTLKDTAGVATGMATSVVRLAASLPVSAAKTATGVLWKVTGVKRPDKVGLSATAVRDEKRAADDGRKASKLLADSAKMSERRAADAEKRSKVAAVPKTAAAPAKKSAAKKSPPKKAPVKKAPAAKKASTPAKKTTPAKKSPPQS